MSLKLYNTLTRKKEIFKPIEKSKVKIYACGPTVYWYQHIGNLRRYIVEDILYRTLVFNNYKVKHIINVTDVGHLTSDADEGEDKVEKAAQQEGKTAKQISQHYFNAFLDDLKKLNFIEPEKWTWATEHIQEQIDFVKGLEKKGYTYKTSDGIYFNTSKLKDYGKLAKLNLEGLEPGKRVQLGEKKNKTDFALWKFSENPGKRQQEWNSPWGIGFPGWHIECSAMSLKYLGERFDIHTGGIDHISVHHTNEIAQTESLTEKKPWVKYWIHSNFLNLKKGKMSKSKREIIRINDLQEKSYDALAFRYLCLLTHYRKKIDFDFSLMDSSQQTYKRAKSIISEIKDNGEINKKYLKEFQDAINDDLNTPKAIQVLWKLLRDEKAKGKIKTIKRFDDVLGLDLTLDKEIKIPDEIKKLVEKREKYRSEKNFKKADELREKIKELGFALDDYEKQTKIRKI